MSGPAELTMHQVAEEADVSKGLIHYHFHDKETLLARAVEWMTGGIIAREQEALATATPVTAFDDLWTWLADELRRGHLRVLVELGSAPEPLVRAAIRAADMARRETAANTVEKLFSLLGLRLRLPAAMVADILVLFIDGLVIAMRLGLERNPRESFDVIWLSLLSLVE